jgi:putative endonuclease
MIGGADAQSKSKNKRKKQWSVYLLCCRDGTLYCGMTNDVARRLQAHGRGAVKYTRGRLPVAIAHVEAAASRSDALKREAAWKRLSRTEKLRRITCAQRQNSLCAPDEEASGRARSRARRRLPQRPRSRQQ